MAGWDTPKGDTPMPPGNTDRLTAVAVKAATFQGNPFKKFDGGGLFLHVKAAGSYWRLKYRFGGKEKLLALGVYPAVTLKDAREKRDEARRLLAREIDPSARRQAQKAADAAAQANSFEDVAREWWEQVHRHRVVPSHAARNLRRLELHIFPAIGQLPIHEVTAPQLLAALRQVEQTGSIETAHRLRSLAGQVFRYAISTERAERDIAADLRDTLRPAETKHHAAIVDPGEISPRSSIPVR